MARPEVNLSHILNVYGDLDRMPVYPQDAYVRTQWAALGHVQYLQGTEDKKISEYEKKMEVWSKDCGMAMPIVKSIYSEQIKLELRQYLPPAQYMNPSRDNINRIMQRVRVIHGGYSVQKSDLSVQRFKDTPKFTSANSVAPTFIQMNYEIKLRESWSDLALGVDYRFTEAEKKSRLVSLLDAWDELKILHTRLWSTAVQNGLTFEQIVDEIMVSIQPLQERELIEQQMAAMTDRNHGTQHVSMSAYNNSNSPRKLEHGRKCFNCGSLDGHRSTECPAPKCSWCNTVWASIRAPGYHHNTRCPHEGSRGMSSGEKRVELDSEAMEIDDSDQGEGFIISANAMKSIVDVVEQHVDVGMIDAGSNIQLATYAFAVKSGRKIELETRNRYIGTAEQQGSLAIYGWIEVGGYIGVMAVCKGAAFTLLSVGICQSRGLGCDFPPIGSLQADLICHLYIMKDGRVRQELQELEMDQEMQLYFVDINSISDLHKIPFVSQTGDYTGPGALRGGSLGTVCHSRISDEGSTGIDTDGVIDPEEDDDPTGKGYKEAVVASLSKRKQKPTYDMCRRVWNLHENLGHAEMHNVSQQIKNGDGG